jgi:hypothetical protein
MSWYIFFIVWGAVLGYCVYEFLTAPLIEYEKETTNGSTNIGTTTE